MLANMRIEEVADEHEQTGNDEDDEYIVSSPSRSH